MAKESEHRKDTGIRPQGTNPQDELRQMHRMLNLLLNLSDTQKQELLEFHKGNMQLFNIENIPHDVKLYYPTNWADARAIFSRWGTLLNEELSSPSGV